MLFCIKTIILLKNRLIGAFRLFIAPIGANYHVVRKAGTWFKKLPIVLLQNKLKTNVKIKKLLSNESSFSI